MANSLPAINDVTASELRSVVAKAAEVDPTIRAARDSAVTIMAANNGRVPPYRGEPARAGGLQNASQRVQQGRCLPLLTECLCWLQGQAFPTCLFGSQSSSASSALDKAFQVLLPTACQKLQHL